MAYKQYNAIRNRNHKDVINNIYNNITKLENKSIEILCGVLRNDVEIAFNHVFNDLHDLGKGLSLFEPDYDMAIWTRLIRWENIEYKDLVLLRHERLERYYMKLEGMSYAQAHDKTNETYNYQELLRKEGLEKC